jgi:hypothetical protein
MSSFHYVRFDHFGTFLFILKVPHLFEFVRERSFFEAIGDKNAGSFVPFGPVGNAIIYFVLKTKFD